MRVRFALPLLTLVFAAAPLMAQGKTGTICKDGTTSAVTGRGACSGHGGVDAKATNAAKQDAKAATAAAKAEKAKAADAKVDKAADAGSEKAAKADKKADKAVTTATAKAKKAAAKAEKAEEKADNDANGATAQCKDGTYSHAASHQGACSKHGGVAKFLK